MIESIKTFLLVIILIYAIVITILFWQEYKQKTNYMKDKENSINYKTKELEKRESRVVDKEICFRELTRLQTIQNTAIEVLKSATHMEIPKIIIDQPSESNSDNVSSIIDGILSHYNSISEQEQPKSP